MILVDANLLIYAYMDGVPQHPPAKKWLEHELNGPHRVGLPWGSLLSFVRISSNRRIFERPSPILSSWRQVEEWLGRERVWIPEPTSRHQELLGELLAQVGEDVNLVPDAHLAALAIEHELTLYSADRGFSHFSGLRWENPLQPSSKAAEPEATPDSSSPEG